MDENHLERIRRAEIELLQKWFKPGMRVLEIGGGNGVQARILADWGCKVESVDLVESLRGRTQHYPVQAYDGRHIPFPDCSFDVVFSSNVLEHVLHLSGILREMSRVLRLDGVAIHILPSSAWRFWTSLAHYVHIGKRLVGLGTPAWEKSDGGDSSQTIEDLVRQRGWRHLLKRLLADGPHGAYPSELHELYAFSQSRWIRVFRKHGYEVVQCDDNNLFYTGYGLFPSWSHERRRAIRKFLGAVARIYVLRHQGTRLHC